MTKRNAYITVEIGLTSDEAIKFIPMENKMKEKLFDLGRECRKLNRNAHMRKKMSNEMYLKLIDCNIETRLKEAQLEQEYYEKFKQLLSPEKLYKYQQAEFKFIREFMRNPPGAALPGNGRDQRPSRDTKTTNGKKQNTKGGN
jgi:ribosomal protein L17